MSHRGAIMVRCGMGVVCLLACPVFGAKAAIAQGQEVSSGLAVGERPEQFNVRDCTGPAAGKTLCYFCRYGSRPVVCVFAREMTAEIATLVERLNDAVDRYRDQRLAAFLVYLGDDTQQAEQRLKEIARSKGIGRTPLTIYQDAPRKLIANLRLSPDAAVTVMMWRDAEVIACYGLASSRLTEEQIDRVLRDTQKVCNRADRD